MMHANEMGHRVRARWNGALLPLILAAGAGLQAQEALKKIEVRGTVKLNAETVIFKAGVKEGDDPASLDFSAIVERLWASKAFDDVKLELEDTDDGPKLIIIVKERPLVKEVDYRGGTEIGLTSIKDKIKEKKLEIKPDTAYDPDTARKIKDQIVDMAAEKGFRTPVVDVNLESMGPGISRLVFDIKEGGKVRIYKVRFRGTKAVTDRRLRYAMEKTRQHWMFSWMTSHDLLVDKNLEEDLENLKKIYWRLGYKDVFVGKPTITVEDKTTKGQKKKNDKRIKEGKSPKYDLRATLEIPVLEGGQFYEGDFKVEGHKLFSDRLFQLKYAEAKRDNRSWVKKFLGLKPRVEGPRPGEKILFDLDAVNQALKKISEAYSDQGYVRAYTEKTLTSREADGVKKVDIALKVDEGEMHTVRRIEFEGNTTTKDKVLRRSMLLREGDPFRTEVFKDSLLRISQLSFFDVKSSTPDVQFVPGKPQVDLTVRGEEAGVNEILFQGGYGSVFGFSLGASFSTRNLGGGGETLSFNYQGGKFQKSFQVAFTEPFVFDRPYSFGASIGSSSTDYSRLGPVYAYTQKSRNFGINLGARLSNWMPTQRWAGFTSVGFGYNYRLLNVSGAQNLVFRDVDSLLTSSVNPSIAYDTVNHPFKPTRGTKLAFALEYGGWQFGSDKPYMRSTLDFTRWGNFDDRHIFGVNMTYGFIQKLGPDALPVYELFRPGGENSIRGYRYGQVGSVVFDTNGQAVAIGGNKQFIANLEYQFKVADPFRVVLFYDLGNAWGSGTKVFSEALRRSTGVELRFFLPISPAPMRLIWSRKLNPYGYDREGQNDFQFSIGTTF